MSKAVVTLLGGTGKSGQYVLRELIHRGYLVRMLVRKPGKHPLSTHTSVVEVVGNARNPHDIALAMEGASAVLSTLGYRGARDAHLCTRAVQYVLEQRRDHRVIALTGAGAFVVEDQPTFIDKAFRWLIHRMDPQRLEDGESLLQLLKGSSAPWVVFRTPLQVSCPARGEVTLGFLGTSPQKLYVSREHIANCMVQAIEDDTYLHQAPVISGI